MKKRFTLTNTSIVEQWRCCDFEFQISCLFTTHKFNETQVFDVSESTSTDPNVLSKAMREMGEWLSTNHYNIAMPPIEEKSLNRILIGRRIMEIRESQGLSQADIAEICQIRANTVNNIEHGKFAVNIDILSKIAKALNCKVDFIECDS